MDPGLLPARRRTLSHFDLVANLHREAHRDDACRRGVALGSENTDLAENLPRLARHRAVAKDREHIAGLQLVVAAEVDLHEIADRQAELEAFRVDDVAAVLVAWTVADRRQVGDARDRDREL